MTLLLPVAFLPLLLAFLALLAAVARRAAGRRSGAAATAAPRATHHRLFLIRLHSTARTELFTLRSDDSACSYTIYK